MNLDPAIVLHYSSDIGRGLCVTIGLSVVVIVLGTLLGTAVALARETGPRGLRWAAATYVNAFRAMPALLVLYFTFYALPQFGLRPTPLEAATLGLVLVGTAYLAEDIRGGLNAIDPGQWRAAAALGLPWGWTVRRIILPQVARVITAPYITRAMLIVKSTSIAGVVAVEDLTGVTYGLISLTYQAIEFLTVTALLYLLLNSVLSLVQVWAERRFGPARIVP